MKQKQMFFLQSACFLHDPVNVGNLISGSSASSKPSLYIWNFSVHILMKSSLKDFELYLLACEMSATVVWIFFGTAFLWDWNENWLFQSSGHCWVFQICWHIECSTLIALSFRILNNSTGILSWFEVQEKMCAGYIQISPPPLYIRDLSILRCRCGGSGRQQDIPCRYWGMTVVNPRTIPGSCEMESGDQLCAMWILKKVLHLSSQSIKILLTA